MCPPCFRPALTVQLTCVDWLLPQANLKTYRFIDNVWTFVLDDATFTLSLGKSSETIRCESAKIVAAAAPPR